MHLLRSLAYAVIINFMLMAPCRPEDSGGGPPGDAKNPTLAAMATPVASRGALSLIPPTRSRAGTNTDTKGSRFRRDLRKVRVS